MTRGISDGCLKQNSKIVEALVCPWGDNSQEALRFIFPDLREKPNGRDLGSGRPRVVCFGPQLP